MSDTNADLDARQNIQASDGSGAVARIDTRANLDAKQNIQAVDGDAVVARIDNNADLDARQKLAQQVFDTIIKANEHQDNKASRIIGSVSFLLAASGAVLSFSLPTSGGTDRVRSLLNSPEQTYVFGVHPALLSFSIFVGFVVIGVLLYLNALGPSFNWKREKEPQDLNKTESTILFFEEVGKHRPIDLIDHISNSPLDDVKRQIIGNLAAESVLVAQKLKGKVAFLQVGSIFFRFGIPWLIPLLVSNYSRSVRVTLLTYALAISIPLFSMAWFEYKPHQINKGSAEAWRNYLIIGILILLLGAGQLALRR